MSAKTTQLFSSGEFANCIMTLYLLKVHLQTFPSIPINENCRILSCDNLVANERYISNCAKFYIVCVSVAGCLYLLVAYYMKSVVIYKTKQKKVIKTLVKMSGIWYLLS